MDHLIGVKDLLRKEAAQAAEALLQAVLERNLAVQVVLL